MKPGKLSKIVFIITLVFGFFTCQKSDETPVPEAEAETEAEAEFEPTYVHGLAAKETGNAEFPYMVQHENGEVLLLTAKNDEPTGAIYFVDENTIVQMFLNDDMLMDKVIYNNEVIVLFENYHDGLVDIAVIKDNDFTTYRDVDMPLDQSSKAFSITNREGGWSAFFGALNTTINISLCAISAVSAVVPAIAITCGGALVGSLMLFGPSDNNILNGTASTVGIAANTYGCIPALLTRNPLVIAPNCINSMLDAAGLAAGQAEELRQSLTEIIALARGGLQTGDGDVKFTLTWDNDTDLDLYVTEPSGDVIWFGNKFSTTGGQLDTDDQDGEGPENIFWPTDFARPGSYRVEVKMYSGNKETIFWLKPKVGDAHYYPTLIFGIKTDNEVVFVGNYVLTVGEGGKLISKWQDKSEVLSSIQNLTATKEPN